MIISSGPQLGSLKNFFSISFSLINGYLIGNALCSDVLCSKIKTGGDPPDGSLAVSAYNKMLFFPLFSFLNHERVETNKPLASKKKRYIAK